MPGLSEAHVKAAPKAALPKETATQAMMYDKEFAVILWAVHQQPNIPLARTSYGYSQNL